MTASSIDDRGEIHRDDVQEMRPAPKEIHVRRDAAL
jgi:hypothetical protein